MSERISDEDLEHWERDPSEMDGEHLPTLIAELRDRRARDLSAEEVEALRKLHAFLIEEGDPVVDMPTWVTGALAAITKLIGGAK